MVRLMDAAFIAPPVRIPWLLRLGLWAARKITGRDLLPARLLAWYPKAALSSGVMEALIAHGEGQADERTLKLVRMAVSFTAGCSFCMDMNSTGWEKLLTRDELAALQDRAPLASVTTFTAAERLAVTYTRLASQTPLRFPQDLIAQLKAQFTPREIVILAMTAAQVNYWTRLIQALGCPPAGFNDDLTLILPPQ